MSAARRRTVFRTSSHTIQQLIGMLALSPRGGSQRRQSPVRRIDDLRRAQTRQRHFEPITVPPERVVGIRGFFARRGIGGFGAQVELSLLRGILELSAER